MSMSYDADRLAAAKVVVTQRYPYLALALHRLQVVPVPGLGTFGVDAAWRLYVDPEPLDRWSVAEVAAVLVHELWHLLRDHAARAAAAGVDDEDAVRWNLAADAEINDDLDEEGLSLPGSPVLPRHVPAPRGLTAEAYFARLRQSPRRADCGSGAGGRRGPGELDAGNDAVPAVGRTEAELLRRETARLVADAARAGHVAGRWRRWAIEVLEPRVDWRRTLAAAVRGGLSAVAGRVDFSYRRLSRRTPASPGIVLPGLCRPRARVVVVVDTSGSVTDGALGQALGEVDGVLRGAGVREVRVLACDAAVHATARVRRVADVVLAGGGGTDMAAGINAAVATRPAPDLVVVLTDGFTPWPSTPPPARVVVGLLAPGTAPPSWATVVVCHG